VTRAPAGLPRKGANVAAPPPSLQLGARSLAFHRAPEYAQIGAVPETEFGRLTMLQLPDAPFVSLEMAG